MQLSEKHNYVPTFEKYADGIKFQMKTVNLEKNKQTKKKVKVNSQLIMAFNHWQVTILDFWLQFKQHVIFFQGSVTCNKSSEI